MRRGIPVAEGLSVGTPFNLTSAWIALIAQLSKGASYEYRQILLFGFANE